MYRAGKSGLAAEFQAKIEGKYDPERASQCLQWALTIFEENGSPITFETSGERQNFSAVLDDGYVLAHLITTLQPGCIPESKRKNRPKMQFKKMELIGLFLESVKAFGVSDDDLFTTIDLTESQDLNQVVNCLQALGRKAGLKGFTGFGPKESEVNVRNFTEEQLKAGQNVIGLQYGSNKGASQAGMNFGKTRMILD